MQIRRADQRKAVRVAGGRSEFQMRQSLLSTVRAVFESVNAYEIPGVFQDFFLIREEGRGTWRPVEALTANSHRKRDADERRDLRPLTWKRRAESRSSPAVGSTRERITAAVEGPPCCDEEEVWRRDAGEETRGETGIVQGS
ncbi:hypothetical protein NDU88_000798 [Pleurodeles waltl]|uniref:Uncharacterized protein n=1 Tax=Pleurodeles waltl TaxID=8319 RepID=A0AAV7S5K6_PLEWA|nr:hypothetical protein NDU88_000798 [Pleurodeles waltl]